VASAMVRDFPRVSPDQPLTDVLPLASAPGRVALVFEDDGRLVGLLTSDNLLQFILLRQAAVAQQKQTEPRS